MKKRKKKFRESVILWLYVICKNIKNVPKFDRFTVNEWGKITLNLHLKVDRSKYLLKENLYNKISCKKYIYIRWLRVIVYKDIKILHFSHKNIINNDIT